MRSIFEEDVTEEVKKNGIEFKPDLKYFLDTFNAIQGFLFDTRDRIEPSLDWKIARLAFIWITATAPLKYKTDQEIFDPK
jgi:hypothetical protein